MNQWVSALFLVAGLFLSSSALTEEECKPLIAPKDMSDHSGMIGHWNFIVGYNNDAAFSSILKMTQSSRTNVTQSETSPNDLIMIQENRINGSCIGSKAAITIDGLSAHAHMLNVSSKIESLPTCSDCLLFHVCGNTSQIGQVLEKLHVEHAEHAEVVHFDALYLMSKGTTLEESDLEHFKKQAECLGFTGEPGFSYDAKAGFCNEDEIVQLQV